MGISPEYREFRSREGYDQFFQEVRDAGPNCVDMYVEPIDGGQPKLCRTYIVNPEIDFKIKDFITAPDSPFAGRWVIRPVENLQEYRDNTDKHSYRVLLRKAQVIQYRKFMTKDNIFMPFLVFDADRKVWLSGRHRSEGWKVMGENAALFALVLHGLTDEESLYITDITNQWHQESWSEDERALVGLGWMDHGMTQKEALEHVELENNRDYILGAKLYRHLDQQPGDRWLIESGVEGHGHPYSLKTVGRWVAIFGEDSIKEFGTGKKAKAKWEHLKEPIAKKVLALVKEVRPTRHVEAYGKYLSLIPKNDWVLTGSSKERWLAFAKLEQRVRQIDAEKIAHVSGPTDDRIWMNFVYKYTATSDAGLAQIKHELNDRELEQSAEVVARLSRTFGS